MDIRERLQDIINSNPDVKPIELADAVDSTQDFLTLFETDYALWRVVSAIVLFEFFTDFTPEEVWSYLENLLKDSHWEVRLEAYTTMGAIHHYVVHSAKSEYQKYALPLELILPGITDPDARVQAATITALQKFEQSDYLRKFLNEIFEARTFAPIARVAAADTLLFFEVSPVNGQPNEIHVLIAKALVNQTETLDFRTTLIKYVGEHASSHYLSALLSVFLEGIENLQTVTVVSLEQTITFVDLTGLEPFGTLLDVFETCLSSTLWLLREKAGYSLIILWVKYPTTRTRVESLLQDSISEKHSLFAVFIPLLLRIRLLGFKDKINSLIIDGLK